MSLSGFAERRKVAERVAVDELARCGDPVASAVKAAVREATTVEITPELVASFSHCWGSWERPDGATDTEFLLQVAYQVAGFEVVQ